MINFIIVNYNDFETTKKFIDNIKNYNHINEIVVVDNASSDNSYDELKKISEITLLKNTSNKGYGSGINVGLKYLEKYEDSYVVISNPDIIIKREEDLINLTKKIKNDIGLVGPVIIEKEGLNRGWVIPTPFKDVLFNIPFLYKKFEKKFKYYSDDFYKDNISYVEAISGCFFVSKLSILKSVGYFDENVFLYYEENILGKKLQKKNIKTICCNDIFVIHNHSVTIDKNINKYKKYKILKQSQYYFQKNYSSANAVEKILLLVTIKIGEIFHFIRSIF